MSQSQAATAIADAKLGQHEVVILRRLASGPLTEFELSREVAEASGFSESEAASRMSEWVIVLKNKGMLFAGSLTDMKGTSMIVAALTSEGRKLVQ